MSTKSSLRTPFNQSLSISDTRKQKIGLRNDMQKSNVFILKSRLHEHVSGNEQIQMST